ncbi:MAG: hypothetical protein JJ992_06900 [Planctomycetes bacterium]|nr:hypothetical protein [Planctomycetota bacterium]
MHDCSSRTQTHPMKRSNANPVNREPASSTTPLTVYFQQPCPTCGRRLRILVQYLGWQVACPHCGRSFVARDVSQDDDETGEANPLLERVDRLLGLLDRTS